MTNKCITCIVHKKELATGVGTSERMSAKEFVENQNFKMAARGSFLIN
jgi:hypothetical protein